MSSQPRELHAAFGFKSKLFVWGGSAGGDSNIPKAGEIQVFDVASSQWERQRLEAENHPQLEQMAYTSERQHGYTFGGNDLANSGFRINTIYKIDLQTLKLEKLSPQDGTAPAAANASSMVFCDEKLLVYSGKVNQLLDPKDLYVFDLSKCRWLTQETTGDTPPSLSAHTFTNVGNNRAVMFGGDTQMSGEKNDVYMLDTRNWIWTKIRVTGDKPPARQHHAACCITDPRGRSYLLVIGGFATAVNEQNDMWVLDVDKRQWTKIILLEDITPRKYHSATVFQLQGDIVVALFGGSFSNIMIPTTTLLYLQFQRDSWTVTKVKEI